jgi:hypothetical protein
MVPLHQLGIIMPPLTENQLTDIVDMIVDDYGSRLTGGEVSEIAGLILENNLVRPKIFAGRKWLKAA